MNKKTIIDLRTELRKAQYANVIDHLLIFRDRINFSLSTPNAITNQNFWFPDQKNELKLERLKRYIETTFPEVQLVKIENSKIQIDHIPFGEYEL